MEPDSRQHPDRRRRRRRPERRDERERVTRKFGMLFQGAALFDSLPVWENVAFGLIQSKGMNRHAARERSAWRPWFRWVSTPISRIAPPPSSPAACRNAPGWRVPSRRSRKFCFFDEPTTGLDPIMGSVIDEPDREIGSRTGCDGALTITHDMASARRIADNIAMIYEGRIVWHGPVADIDDSGNDMLDQFIHGRSDGPIQLRVAS